MCNADAFILKEVDEYTTSKPPNYPYWYEKVAGYVMKRNGSMVLVVTDNLTYNTSTALIKSEKAGDIENALLKPYYHIKPR